MALRAASSAAAAQLSLEPTPLNEITTNQNAASGKLNSVNTFLTIKNSIPGAQINSQYPIYSYKQYKPLPTVVYTQHEEEANDLIGGLKPGYVFFSINIYIYIHNFLISLSPVAFDMEWRFYFVNREFAGSKRMVERRTAVVQVADSNGFILVIQIYDMKRMFISACLFLSHCIDSKI